jgi:hypothetical protein
MSQDKDGYLRNILFFIDGFFSQDIHLAINNVVESFKINLHKIFILIVKKKVLMDTFMDFQDIQAINL